VTINSNIDYSVFTFTEAVVTPGSDDSQIEDLKLLTIIEV
jgi:hypothetical protein